MVLSKCADWYFMLFIGKLESQCTDKKPFVIKSIDFFIRYIPYNRFCGGRFFIFWKLHKNVHFGLNDIMTHEGFMV